MNITMLCSFKNYVLLRNNITGYIWLYSYNNPIAYYDGKIHICKDNLTQTNKKHISVFKDFLENMLTD